MDFYLVLIICFISTMFGLLIIVAIICKLIDMSGGDNLMDVFWWIHHNVKFYWNRWKGKREKKNPKEDRLFKKPIRKNAKKIRKDLKMLSNIQYDLWVEVLKVLERKKISHLYKPKMKQCKLTIELEPKQEGLKPVELNLFLNAFEKVVPYLEAAVYKEVQNGNLYALSNENDLTIDEKGIFELYKSDVKLLLNEIRVRKKLDLNPVYDAFFDNDNLTPASLIAWFDHFTPLKMLELVECILHTENKNLYRLITYLGVVCDKIQKLRKTGK